MCRMLRALPTGIVACIGENEGSDGDGAGKICLEVHGNRADGQGGVVRGPGDSAISIAQDKIARDLIQGKREIAGDGTIAIRHPQDCTRVLPSASEDIGSQYIGGVGRGGDEEKPGRCRACICRVCDKSWHRSIGLHAQRATGNRREGDMKVLSGSLTTTNNH